MSELGTKLREARVEKGYTLNTLQQMTKIQKNIYKPLNWVITMKCLAVFMCEHLLSSTLIWLA